MRVATEVHLEHVEIKEAVQHYLEVKGFEVFGLEVTTSLSGTGNTIIVARATVNSYDLPEVDEERG